MLAGELIRKLLDEGLPEQISYILDREGYPFLRALLDGCPRLRELLASLLNPEVLGPEEFYAKLADDIKNAKEGTRVEIRSPFLRKQTVEQFVNLVRTKRLNVTVITKPPDDKSVDRPEDHRKCIEVLEQAARVEQKLGMHEKSVVIGERVAYLGSMNVLSRWGGKEGKDYMLRFEGPLVGELIRDLESRLTQR